MAHTHPYEVSVVKLGGSVGKDPRSFCRDAAELLGRGQRIVIVHGGSEHTNELAEALGHPSQFITSPSGHTSRRTDRRTLEIMQMACRGLLNQQIVEQLQGHGVRAIGLSGMDGGIWRGERKAAIRAVVDGRVTVVRDDFTGAVSEVNVTLLRTLLDAGLTPVLSPPAVSFGGEPINVDADRAAAMTAAALGARNLLLLSNVPGLLAKFPDESSLIDRLPKSQIEAAQSAAQGRMKKKVLGASEALERGVRRVVIGDARRRSPITEALLGVGTVIE
ncbi:MAG: [LysW]-aminoadipate kinase [Phycisphaerae bacterium]|nr:[LysW]-aminoadipate kinase [Phycisphaerae bacterium]